MPKWAKALRAYTRALTDSTVALTMIATVGAIAAILTYAVPQPTRLTLGFCAVVAIAGAVSVIYQIRRLYRLDMTRERLSEMLLEGKRLSNSLRDGSLAIEVKPQAEDWYKRTESVVARYLRESYLARLELQGFRDDPTSTLGLKIERCLEA